MNNMLVLYFKPQGTRMKQYELYYKNKLICSRMLVLSYIYKYNITDLQFNNRVTTRVIQTIVKQLLICFNNVLIFLQIMVNIIYSIIWLIIFIFLSLWLAAFAAGFYIILLPLTVCIEALSVGIRYTVPM